jgi:type VI secretion system protein ImpJ
MTRPTTPADLPYGVQWSEGLLLSPQHLQQNDRFWQAQMRYLIERANPDFAGVRALELDEGLLEKGRVVVRSIECVLDDGTPVLLLKDRDSALELDAAKVLVEAGDRAYISLVLPVRGDAAAAAGSMNRRYASVDGAAAVDENTGTGPVAVARLRPAVRLDPAWTPGANLLTGCRLFELERTALGSFRRTAYHPPLASLAASGFLKERALRPRVEALRDLVRMKLREIAQVGEGTSHDPSTGDPALVMAARCLAMILPSLDVLGLGTDVAPRALYLFLAQATGQIAALDALPDPPVLPPYDHLDCQPGFDTALSFIEAHVQAIRPSFERLPFERDAREGRGEFSRVLPIDVGDTLLIEVVPANAQNRTDLERWMEGCTIGHPQLLEQLDNRRMPGAGASPALARHKGLNPAAMYYEIRNEAFDFSDGMRKVFTPGEPLTIRGGGRHAGTHAPAGIVLYRAPNRAGQRGNHDGLAAGGSALSHGQRDSRDPARDPSAGPAHDESLRQARQPQPQPPQNGEGTGHARY